MKRRLSSRARFVLWSAFACAAALLWLPGSALTADAIRIGGSGAALGTMRLLGEAFRTTDPGVPVTIVESLGSSGGITAVASSAIDIGVTSRPMTPAEHRLGLTETEYGRTPFVLAVSSKSKTAAITLPVLADIYAGRLQKWPDGSPVRIILRPASDIDTELLSSLSPDMKAALALADRRPGVQFSVNDQDAADDLERIPGAIGPTSLALIVSERRALKPLKLDGKDPTPANGASGRYPYFKRLYLVTGARRSPAVERFIVFIRSPAGQKILTASGIWIP